MPQRHNDYNHLNESWSDCVIHLISYRAMSHTDYVQAVSYQFSLFLCLHFLFLNSATITEEAKFAAATNKVSYTIHMESGSSRVTNCIMREASWHINFKSAALMTNKTKEVPSTVWKECTGKKMKRNGEKKGQNKTQLIRNDTKLIKSMTRKRNLYTRKLFNRRDDFLCSRNVRQPQHMHSHGYSVRII